MESHRKATRERSLPSVIAVEHADWEIIYHPMNSIIIVDSTNKGVSLRSLQLFHASHFTSFRNFDVELLNSSDLFPPR